MFDEVEISKDEPEWSDYDEKVSTPSPVRSAAPAHCLHGRRLALASASWRSSLASHAPRPCIFMHRRRRSALALALEDLAPLPISRSPCSKSSLTVAPLHQQLSQPRLPLAYFVRATFQASSPRLAMHTTRHLLHPSTLPPSTDLIIEEIASSPTVLSLVVAGARSRVSASADGPVFASCSAD